MMKARESTSPSPTLPQAKLERAGWHLRFKDLQPLQWSFQREKRCNGYCGEPPQGLQLIRARVTVLINGTKSLKGGRREESS